MFIPVSAFELRRLRHTNRPIKIRTGTTGIALGIHREIDGDRIDSSATGKTVSDRKW